MIRTYQYKLYPNATQIKALDGCLTGCCLLYNRALEMRIKAYKRRKESVGFFAQSAWLTVLREKVESMRAIPRGFEEDAVRRVDRNVRAFFRRLGTGRKPGFPRYRSSRRYNSMEYLKTGRYFRGTTIFVPGMGAIRCRGRSAECGPQKSVRIIRRPTGWYAQIAVEVRVQESNISGGLSVGVDVGISSFATMSDGSSIANPRWLINSARKLRALQRRVSRRKKGSHRRRVAVSRLARRHERLASQRTNFCHQHSTSLVRQYDLIAVEKLNVAGMVRSRFAKSILDAAWSTFTTQLVAKAEYAGRQVVFVNPRYTSQECPNCGAIKPKKLSERTHSCECGLVCQRDHAAAQVILARALAGKRGESRVEGIAKDRRQLAAEDGIPVNRVGSLGLQRFIAAPSDGRPLSTEGK